MAPAFCPRTRPPANAPGRKAKSPNCKPARRPDARPAGLPARARGVYPPDCAVRPAKRGDIVHQPLPAWPAPACSLPARRRAGDDQIGQLDIQQRLPGAVARCPAHPARRRPVGRVCKAASNAASSTSPPRAVLISSASGFITASSAAPIRPRVSSFNGKCKLSTSASASAVSNRV